MLLINGQGKEQELIKAKEEEIALALILCQKFDDGDIYSDNFNITFVQILSKTFPEMKEEEANQYSKIYTYFEHHKITFNFDAYCDFFQTDGCGLFETITNNPKTLTEFETNIHYINVLINESNKSLYSLDNIAKLLHNIILRHYTNYTLSICKKIIFTAICFILLIISMLIFYLSYESKKENTWEISSQMMPSIINCITNPSQCEQSNFGRYQLCF